MIDANEAKQLGLVNYVTTPETLLEHTRKILEIINSKAPLLLQVASNQLTQYLMKPKTATHWK